ncbi:MAG: MATE family efflux transporter [Deltaproteobacteria bacterium]|nr:MATE family efflux transporter [Deltaproteobacteria bacterium]
MDAPAKTAPEDLGRRRILTEPVPWTVFRLAAPIALAMVFQVLFNLVDQYLISRLPPQVADPSLDALGICDMVAAVGTIISYGISVATTALVARHHGAGEDREAERLAWGSLGLVTVLGVFFGLVALVGSDWIVGSLVGAKGVVRDLSARYLRVIMGGNITVFMLYQLTSIQRAYGHARSPLVVMIVGNAVNLVLAVLLVYGPGEAPAVFSWGPPVARALHLPRLEVLGAAWATLAARSLACAVAFVMLARDLSLRGFWRRLLPAPEVARRLVDLAWPASAQFIVRTCGMLAVVSLVHHYFTTAADSTAGTAFAVCLRLETVALFVGMGWGGGIHGMIGMTLGAGDQARAKAAGYTAAAYNALTMAALTALYLLKGDQIVGFFTARPEVLQVAEGYLRVVAPSYLLYGVAIVLGNAISAAGATRLALAVDALLVGLIQVPLLWGVVALLGAPLTGLWGALAAVNVLSAVTYLGVYRDGHRWLTRPAAEGASA